MEREQEWTKGITSNVVCGYFYITFMIVSVIAGLIFLGDVIMFVRKPSPGHVMVLIRSLVPIALAVANALFMYIVCARSLLK